MTTRPPILRLGVDELIIDNFAGGGGASFGINKALGRGPDIAINHDPEAIALHKANHPETQHYCESVWDIDPRVVTAGRPVGLAWFSPDCKHFSKAKGGKPVDKNIRGLAWVVVTWAETVKPRVIILENVEEFQTWGPLLEDGTPCPAQKGFTFRQWWRELEKCGYHIEMRELRACDFGAPTTRKRLFIIARSDGQVITWPEPTHGPGRQYPYRTAADCIDWSLECPSIFERLRPLAENTLRRIARGLQRFVIDTPAPFIVPADAGMRTPYLARLAQTGGNGKYANDLREPITTIVSKAEHLLVSPTLVQTGYGEREGQAPRSLDLHQPLGTVVAGGAKHALVAAFLAKHYGGNYDGAGTPLVVPMDTVTTVDHHGLIASHLVKLRGGLQDHHTAAQDLRVPAPTLTAGGNHLAEVRAFLIKYYGTGGGAPLSQPLHTATTQDRFGLVTVEGEDYAIADIGMRMLAPRELYRAQGFPDTYRIEIEFNGKPLSKAAQTRMCGNSVCPDLGAALVDANLGQGPSAAHERTWFPPAPVQQLSLFDALA